MDDNESVLTYTSTKPIVGDLGTHSPAADPAKSTSSNEKTRTSSPKKMSDDQGDFININRRHHKEFNKLKGSDAMKTLLNADDQTEKK